MNPVDVGILSLVPESARLRSGGSRDSLRREEHLARFLRESGRTVIPGGAPYAEEDRLASSPALMRTHVHTLMESRVRAVILNVSEGPDAALATACVRYLERELDAPCRILLHADVAAPGAASALLDVSGALRTSGFPHTNHIGSPDDPRFRQSVIEAVAFNEARHACRGKALETAHGLKKQRLLVVGTALNERNGMAADPEALMRGFGIGVAGLEFSALRTRGTALLGEGGQALDNRVEAGIRELLPRLADDTDAERGLLRRAVADCHALHDLARESGATCVALDARGRGFAGLATALANDVIGPDGLAKDILPTDPAGDPDNAVAQLVLVMATGEPAASATILAVDGEHVRLGGPGATLPSRSEAWTIREAEARGSATLDQDVTLARLTRRDGRWSLHAWEGITATGGDLTVRLRGPLDFLATWPAGRAAVAAGRQAAVLGDLAHQLGIGWSVTDLNGRRYGCL